MEVEILKNDTSIAFRKGTKVLGLIDNPISDYYDDLEFMLEHREETISEMVEQSIRGDDKYGLMSSINREAREKAERMLRPCANTLHKFLFDDEYYHLVHEVSEMYKEVLTKFIEDQKEIYAERVAEYQQRNALA